MRKYFYLSFVVIFAIIGGLSLISPWFAVLLLPFGALFLLGLQNLFQTKKAVLRNFPLVGLFRYLLEMVRPEIQQYFIESETDGSPVPREIRSLVYQRAKEQTDTLPFGTQRNVYAEGYEWISHSMDPQHLDLKNLRVNIGGEQCKKPYSASVFNISAMSYGALSNNAVLALNGGAKLGGFYHNTGEGGVSPYHLSEGGDLVWQIGTGYFGCRKDDGSFDSNLFAEMATGSSIKMIEIKLSQGAKPSHGGILPAAKISPEVMKIRRVPAGKDVISPPAHTAFSGPMGLLKFVSQLRELSGGKPVGFKLCLGRPEEFVSICLAMIESGILPDFITVDGGEGGTGAAPLEFSNSVGAPLEEGLTFVNDVLTGFGLRKKIRIICSGKILTGFNIFSRMALGADLCNSARGMMLALGCIQARRCNTNHCPTGVATSNPDLVYGLVPSDKKMRIHKYHHHTVEAFAELVGATGLSDSSQISRNQIYRRLAGGVVKTYQEIFPEVAPDSFLTRDIPLKYRDIISAASSTRFGKPRHIKLAA